MTGNATPKQVKENNPFMQKDYIQSVGVELEGAIPRAFKQNFWKHCKTKVKHPKRLHGTYDLSLSGFNPVTEWAYEFKYWGSSFEVKNWLKIMFEDYQYKANKSCGFHIHIKMDREQYKLACCKDFWDGFKKEYVSKYQTKPRYIDRINYRFSEFKYEPNQINRQYKSRSKSDIRYTAINLQSINVHGTLEIRIMPYQTSLEEAEESIDFIANTTNKLLNQMMVNKEKYDLESKEVLKKLNFYEKNHYDDDRFGSTNPFETVFGVAFGVLVTVILFSLIQIIFSYENNVLNNYSSVHLTIMPNHESNHSNTTAQALSQLGIKLNRTTIIIRENRTDLIILHTTSNMIQNIRLNQTPQIVSQGQPVNQTLPQNRSLYRNVTIRNS